MAEKGDREEQGIRFKQIAVAGMGMVAHGAARYYL
jgi:hypothetical protein